MSDIFQVTTNNIIPTRKASIDGVVYTVRRKGSGDDLDISLRASRLSKLGRDAMAERVRYNNAKTEEAQKEFGEKMEKIVAEISKTQNELEMILAGLFDDGGDQSKSIAMVHKYGANGVNQILEQIFGTEANGQE